MFSKTRPCYAEIDLVKLEKNMNSIWNFIGRDKRVMAVVKADAYGHGVLKIREKLYKLGVRNFAVAILDEALEIRKVDKKSSIMLLGFTQKQFAKEVVENDITVTVFTYEEAEGFSKEAVKQNKNVKLSVALDTGMNRIGFASNDESLKEIIKISKLPNVVLEEFFSHFSTADSINKEFSYKQLEKYNNFIEKLKNENIVFNHYHMANSGAITDIKEAHFDTVRPGIIMYGYYPSEEVKKENINIEPILTWKSNLVMVKKIDKGSTISYGNAFKAEEEMLIGTIPLGYADGYNRLLSNKGKVIINGKFCNVVGRVCMDQMMVDLSNAKEAKASDEVIIMGENNGLKYDADDIAKDCNTINHEIICDISLRVPRIYIEY